MRTRGSHHCVIAEESPSRARSVILHLINNKQSGGVPDDEAEKAPGGWPAPHITCFAAEGSPAKADSAGATALSSSSYSYEGAAQPKRPSAGGNQPQQSSDTTASAAPPPALSSPASPPMISDVKSSDESSSAPLLSVLNLSLSPPSVATATGAEQTAATPVGSSSKAATPVFLRTSLLAKGAGGHAGGPGGVRVNPIAGEWARGAAHEPRQAGALNDGAFVKGVALLLLGASVAAYALIRGRRAKRVRVQNSAIAAANVDLKDSDANDLELLRQMPQDTAEAAPSFQLERLSRASPTIKVRNVCNVRNLCNGVAHHQGVTA